MHVPSWLTARPWASGWTSARLGQCAVPASGRMLVAPTLQVIGSMWNVGQIVGAALHRREKVVRVADLFLFF